MKLRLTTWVIALSIILAGAEVISLVIDWQRLQLQAPRLASVSLSDPSLRRIFADSTLKGLAHLDVLEDPTGELQLAAISSPDSNSDFIPSETLSLIFGQSHSFYWLRIQPLQPNLILTVFNPTVESLTFYLPDGKSIQSGWGNSDRSAMSNFVYPHVELTDMRAVYVRMSSNYLQSYTVRLLTQRDFGLLVYGAVVFLTVYLTILLIGSYRAGHFGKETHTIRIIAQHSLNS